MARTKAGAIESNRRAAFRELLASEMQWLYGLSPAQQRQLSPSGGAGAEFGANHFSMAGEVALVLTGRTPGAIIALRKSRGGGGGMGDVHAQITLAYLAAVLRPWLEKHAERWFSHLSLTLREVTASRSANLAAFDGQLAGSWLLLSAAHPLAELAESTLLTPGRRTPVSETEWRDVFRHPSCPSGPRRCESNSSAPRPYARHLVPSLAAHPQCNPMLLTHSHTPP